MLETLLWISAGLWAWFLLQLLLNRSLARDLGRTEVREPERWPFVSIVVPARDEARDIREAVTSFCEQDYPAFEVVVVDDGSTDATPDILRELQARYANLKVVPGRALPEGWLGKPNALETGRLEARGEWMLFVDADVRYAPDLLRRAMAFVLPKDAAMLVLGPNFATGGFWEPVIMSSLYLAGLAMLPVFLAVHSRSKRIALGGGVFNLVRRDALEGCGAFDCLKKAVVDDVGLGFKVKGAGFRQAAALGGRLIHIRMYRGLGETVRGFTKNLYPAIRRVPLFLPFILAMSALLNFLPYVGLGLSLAAGAPSLPAILALAFMHAVFAAIAFFFRQPGFIIFTNPLRELMTLFILFRSLVCYYRRGGVAWRDRTYDFPVGGMG
jgi:chlorobactene glucosyltransferase